MSGGPAGTGETGAAGIAMPDRSPSHRPAVLAPPVLLSDPTAAHFPPLVILDRSMLTPQMRALVPEGVVVVAVLVRTDGSVGEVRIRTSSGNPALDAAAAHVAWGWRFRPATRDGLPTEAWAVIPVRFTAGR